MFRKGRDMKKKKIVIISFFLSLIVITSFIFIKSAIDSYNYDMDPANGVDIFEGFGAAFALIIGGFVVFYELDLFYTVYYFFTKPKTIVKSILNILSNLSLLFIFFSEYYKDIFKEDVIALVFFSYVALRMIYFIISVGSWLKNNKSSIL